MRVSFLYDPGNQDGTLGGAELTMREFIDAAPDNVEVVDGWDADVFVVGNCVTMGTALISHISHHQGQKVFRYHHDLARHENPALRNWLDDNAEHIFTSPLHKQKYGRHGHVIPPAIDLDAYRPTRQAKRHRKNACSIGAWQNPQKGQHLLREWSERANTPLDVYGTGAYVPVGPTLDYKGPLDPDKVAQTLWGYEFFVFLPNVIEPFGRCVVEAWAAGCEVITNNNVGARHFIDNDPDALETAAEDFWWLVTS